MIFVSLRLDSPVFSVNGNIVEGSTINECVSTYLGTHRFSLELLDLKKKRNYYLYSYKLTEY